MTERDAVRTAAEPVTPNGLALIEHTQKQAAVVANCLDSLHGLWRLVACPDPSAHGAEARAVAPEPPDLDVEKIIRERLADYLSCNKEDDCAIQAEGIERALEDVEYERARLRESDR